MPRREHTFFQGSYWHVYCRGNEKKNVFMGQGDYKHFLDKMKEYRNTHNISIICYCLMPNHFHLLLRQNGDESISKFMHHLSVSYSMYFNRRYDRIGHLFQGRFKAKLITINEYLLHVSRYIHLNPLKLICDTATLEDYPWSSYSEYIGRNAEKICDKEIILKQLSSIDYYSAYHTFVNGHILDTEFMNIRSLIIEQD